MLCIRDEYTCSMNCNKYCVIHCVNSLLLYYVLYQIFVLKVALNFFYGCVHFLGFV